MSSDSLQLLSTSFDQKDLNTLRKKKKAISRIDREHSIGTQQLGVLVAFLEGQVPFLKLTCGSQPLVILVLKDLTPFSGICRYCVYMLQRQTFGQTLIHIK